MKRMVTLVRTLSFGAALLLPAVALSAQSPASASSSAMTRAPVAPVVQGGTPEPATMALVGGAAASYLYLRSRRRRERAPEPPPAS